MKKGHNPRSILRSKLLRLCMDKGLSLQEISKIVEPMRECETEEEKEALAQRLILEVEKM